MKYQISYERILHGIMSYYVGDERPHFIQCGPDTFEQIYSYFEGMERQKIGRFRIEDAIVVPVPGMTEGLVRFVNVHAINNPRLNGEVTLELTGDQT